MSPRVMRGISPGSIGKRPKPALKPAVEACCEALLTRLRGCAAPGSATP
jgi:hypothetical protein